MRIKIYGKLAVKFRAFGWTLGYARGEISREEALEFTVPATAQFRLPSIPLEFDRHGIRLELLAEVA